MARRPAYVMRLQEAKDHIETGKHRSAVESAGGGIDMLLKALFDELKKKLNRYDAADLQGAFKRLASSDKGKRGKLTFGGWIRLYDEENLFRRLEGAFGYHFRYFNIGILRTILEVRNDCVHEDYQPTSAESELVCNNFQLFLTETNRAPQEAAPVVPEAEPERSRGSLTPWRDVATPHRDIRERRFDLGLFAIHLGEIALGNDYAQAEYAKAETFFDLTHITRGLRSQLVTMMQRLSNRRTGYAVVQLDTTFGGGKTHTLLSMYHIAKSGNQLKERDDVRGLMNEARVESLTECAVAVLDGSYLAPSEPRVTEDGITLHTLWGEMAYQLDGAKGYEFVRSSDVSRSAPGTGALGKLLRSLGRPSLILMDEVLDYATKAATVRVGRNTFLVDQVQSFLKALTQAVDRHRTSMLVLTLTSSPQQIFGEEAQRLQQQIAEQQAIFKNILDRVQRSEVTTENEEIYEILRRRLFQDPGDSAKHDEIALAYWNYYREHEDLFPDNVRSPEYRDRIAASYPFHPDLIDVLNNRWGTIQNFQKTRGVLRLLALVVSNLYRKNHGAPLIHTGHIDLADPEIRRELLGFVNSPEGYDAAIGSDIAGQADSKANRRDQKISGDYYRYGLCEGLATSIFMYSHSGASDFVGSTRPQLWLSMLQPGIEPALASDAYSKLESDLWYMEKDGTHSRISIEPNLNRMLVEFRDSVAQDRGRLDDAILKTVEDMAGNELGKAIIWPDDSQRVRDSDSLKFIVAPLQTSYAEDDQELGAQLYIEEILKTAGNKHREYRNTLIFLLPTQNGVSRMESAATRLLAFEDIKKARGADLKDRQRAELDQQLMSARDALPSAVWGAYTITATAGTNNEAWIGVESGITSYRAGDTLAQRLLDKLQAESRLLTRFDPDFILHRENDRFQYLWLATKQQINTLELWKDFARYDYLPMLKDQAVLQDTIDWGVSRGLFAYCTGIPGQFDNIYIDEQLTAGRCVLSEHAWLLDAAIARERTAPPPTSDEGRGSVPVDAKESDDVIDVSDEETEKDRTHHTGIDVEIELRPSDWRQFYNSVIQPLVAKGANIKSSVRLSATHVDGFDLDFIELSIREGVIQINRNAKIKIDTNE